MLESAVPKSAGELEQVLGRECKRICTRGIRGGCQLADRFDPHEAPVPNDLMTHI
jgi:hypothetical protein